MRSIYQKIARKRTFNCLLQCSPEIFQKFKVRIRSAPEIFQNLKIRIRSAPENFQNSKIRIRSDPVFTHRISGFRIIRNPLQLYARPSKNSTNDYSLKSRLSPDERADIHKARTNASRIIRLKTHFSFQGPATPTAFKLHR